MVKVATLGIMSTGAEGIRNLIGEDRPAEIKQEITLPPTIIGPYGKAWFVDLEPLRQQAGVLGEEEDAALAHWIIETPEAHPVWHSYSLLLTHLRPMKDNRPTHIYLDGATHELLLFAINPDIDRNKMFTEVKVSAGSWMAPVNFGAQFIEITDELALQRIERTAQMICDGKLSPDTDHLRSWVKLYGNNMIKKEYR